jgi:hypothetical protein
MTQKTDTKCIKIKESFADYLTGELEQETTEAVRSHVSACTTCHVELEELSSLWTQLGVLPEEQPSPNLRKNFYEMLESFQEAEKRPSTWQRIKEQWTEWLSGPKRPAYQLAITMGILVVGFSLGLFFASPGNNNTGEVKNDPMVANAELIQLRGEVKEMRQQLVLAMLDQPSPSNRLKAISVSSQTTDPSAKTLEALLYTLNNDLNDNVRVSAAEALYLFIDNPMVKKGVIDSLPHQSSPLVQVALLDLLAGMREKTSIDALKHLIKNDKLNPAVKKRAEQVMKQMI